jgi:hypothetical protein
VLTKLCCVHIQVLREAEVSTRMNHPNVVATVSAWLDTRNSYDGWF